jgi:hypothetical protein
MAHIAPLRSPFTPGVAAQLDPTTPAGVAPIRPLQTFARNLPTTAAVSGWGRHEHLLLFYGRYQAIDFAARAARAEPEPGAARFADIVAP